MPEKNSRQKLSMCFRFLLSTETSLFFTCTFFSFSCSAAAPWHSPFAVTSLLRGGSFQTVAINHKTSLECEPAALPHASKAHSTVRWNGDSLTLSANTTLNRIMVGISLFGEGSVLDTWKIFFRKSHWLVSAGDSNRRKVINFFFKYS